MATKIHGFPEVRNDPRADDDADWETNYGQESWSLQSAYDTGAPLRRSKVSVAARCGYCGRCDKEMAKCSRCQRVHYCCTAHQRSHWEQGHREACRDPLTEPVTAAKATSIAKPATKYRLFGIERVEQALGLRLFRKKKKSKTVPPARGVREQLSRRRWEAHVDLTYTAVNAFAEDSTFSRFFPWRAHESRLPKIMGELNENQRSIGALFAMIRIYGKPVADAVTGLLLEHIAGAVAILVAVEAAIYRDGTSEQLLGSVAQQLRRIIGSPAVSRAVGKWNVNGRAIAAALAGLPKSPWPQAVLEGYIQTHLDQTVSYARDTLLRRNAEAYETYKEARVHAVENIGTALGKGLDSLAEA